MLVVEPKVSDKVKNGGSNSGRAKTHTDDTKCAKVFFINNDIIRC